MAPPWPLCTALERRAGSAMALSVYCGSSEGFGIFKGELSFRFMKLLSWTFAYVQLYKPYLNGVTLRDQNQSLKYLRDQNQSLKSFQSLELLTSFEMGFRSFNTDNMGSVGQSAAK